MSDLKKDIEGFLKSQRIISLATVSAEGKPMTHPVAYANEGATLYVATYRSSRKVENILRNPSIAYDAYAYSDDWSKTRSIQMEGRAFLVSDEDEIKKALELLAKKFPAMDYLEPDPDSAVLRIEPGICYYSDYSKGFGHIERVEY